MGFGEIFVKMIESGKFSPTSLILVGILIVGAKFINKAWDKINNDLNANLSEIKETLKSYRDLTEAEKRHYEENTKNVLDEVKQFRNDNKLGVKEILDKVDGLEKTVLRDRITG